MKTRTLPCALLGRERKLLLFSDMSAFVRHASDHFLSTQEPWDRVLPRTLLDKIRRKWAPDDVVMVKALYERIADAIIVGIQYAANEPVYIVMNETIKIDQRHPHSSQSFLMLAQSGFVVAVRDSVLRTAHFSCDHPAVSNYTLYKQGWKHIFDRSLKKKHMDDKSGLTHERVMHKYVDDDHWKTCINPYPRPKQPDRISRGVDAEIMDKVAAYE